ncbi:sensor histidine kinase [Homoserinimonas sp. A447]
MRQRVRHAPLTAFAITGALITTLIAVGLAEGETQLSDLIWLSSFAVLALIGSVIVAARARNAIGWVFVGSGAATMLAAIMGELASDGWVLLASLALFGIAWVTLTTLPLLLFPDGRIRDRLGRCLTWAVAVLVLALLVLVAVNPDELVPGIASPLAVPAFAGIASAGIDLLLVASALVTLTAATALVLRWRGAAGQSRRQLSWLGLAALLIIALVVVGFSLGLAFPSLDPAVGAVLEGLQVVALPLATAAAVLDARLFDIDVVFKRSAVYAVVTSAVVVVYAGVLWGATSLIGFEASAVATLAASAIVAVGISPLKDAVTSLVERRLFRDRRNPQRALTAVATGVGAAHEPDELVAAAVAQIGESLHLGYVGIELDGKPGSHWGDSTAERAGFDLIAFGTQLGRLTVAPRNRGDSLTPADLAVVAALTQQLALVAHAATMSESLQASRAALVVAREEERLRLRRDLHDGLGPTLAGMTLQVDALVDSVAADAEAAADLARRVKQSLQGVIASLRRNLDGLRPAELDQLGLAESLAEHARSLSAGGLPVELVFAPLPRIPPAAEVAAYRIATEALANVVRHAGATTCTVRAHVLEGILVIRVDDDGRGIDTAGNASREGVGVPSMRARAEEIGGRLRITERSGGGTTVTAELPLAVIVQ